MGRRVIVFALLAAFGLLAAPANASNGDTGPLGVIRPRAIGGAAKAPTTADARTRTARRRRKLNLVYHGGPVLPNSTVHEIFWDPFGQGYPAGYELEIEQYFTDVAHDSGGTDNVYSVLTQYTDLSGHRANYTVIDAGAKDDLVPVTADGCTPHTLFGFTHCVTDGQIRSEISADFPSPGPHDIFFVFLPPHLDTRDQGLGSLGNGDFCAYHRGTSSGLLYANEPFADVTVRGGVCYTDEMPNASTKADSTINTASHEHAETITNPFGGGWYTSRGAEVADKCAYKWGAYTGDSNQVINGHDYFLQQEWSNNGRRCKQRSGP
jgi:hypothetical protein